MRRPLARQGRLQVRLIWVNKMSLNDTIATFVADTAIAHEIVHGDSSTTVETDNGPVRSLAKLVSDNQALIDAALGLPTRLLEWAYASAFRLASAQYDSNNALTTASIVWPDDSTGTFTTDVASTTFPGAIDAWHATYVQGGVTKTVTQPTVTRNSAGVVTAQPEITVE